MVDFIHKEFEQYNFNNIKFSLIIQIENNPVNLVLTSF